MVNSRYRRGRDKVPDGVRFELTEPYGSTVFKTVALNHSATRPNQFVQPTSACPSLTSDNVRAL